MNVLKSAIVVLVILIAMTLSCPTATAQGFGIKGGPIFPDFSSEDVDFDNKLGTQLGVFVGGNRSGLIGIQGELNWLRKKADVSGTELRLDYLDLAGLLRLNIGTQSPSGFAFYGLVGPGFDFKIGDELGGINTSDTFKSFDVSLLFGGGVEIKRIIFEGRYQRGLRSITEDITATEIKSHSFAILVGFRFR
jgi:outer membrane protein with beta-barrel domain